MNLDWNWSAEEQSATPTFRSKGKGSPWEIIKD